MTDWVETTLGHFVSLQRGHDLTEPERRPGQVPVMGSAGQNGFHDTALAKGPGVVIGRSGASFGQVHFTATDYWPHNTCLYVTNFLGNDPEFAYYFLKTVRFEGHNSGSAQPSLNRNFIYPIPVRVPTDASEQRAIAGVLRVIDNKIGLNRRMSQTLEGIAQAIFKSWFTDFEPVRAKAAGARDDDIQARFGVPMDLASILPSRLRETDVGPVPLDWPLGSFGDVAQQCRRGVSAESLAPETPYIGLEHMPRRSIALSEWGTAEGLESAKQQFSRGEILFGKLRPYFHKVGVAGIDGVCSTDIVVIRPKEPSWFGFVLGHASSETFVSFTNSGATGTKMPRTSWKEMSKYVVSRPPEPLAAAFSQIIRPCIDAILALSHQTRSLEALRDALLPELLSGTLHVAGEPMSA